MKNPKTPAQRQADYRQRQRDRGLIERTVWVPENQVATLLDYAARLCESAGKSKG